jgi:hypothetical protein
VFVSVFPYVYADAALGFTFRFHTEVFVVEEEFLIIARHGNIPFLVETAEGG